MQRIIPLIVLCLTLTTALSVRAEEKEARKAQKIINRSIDAIGGRKALEKKNIVSIKETGTFYGMGAGLPYEGEFKIEFPNNYRLEILNVFTIVLNEKQGWTSSMGQTVPIEDDQLKEQQESMHAAYVVSLIPLAKPGKTYRLSLSGEENVGGEICDSVKVESDKQRTVKLLFNRKTGLLVKSESKMLSDDLSKVVVQAQTFEDYREVDGVKVAFKSNITRDGKIYIESQATEVNLHKKADPNWFTKP